MSLQGTRRQALAGAAAAGVAMPLVANAFPAKIVGGNIPAPVVQIFDARGCTEHQNKEYRGPLTNGPDDEMCVKVSMMNIKVDSDVANLVLKECLSELKRR